MPTDALVRIPSKAPNDSKKRPLFAVHAIEGFIEAFKPLALKMNCPVWGLQCTADAPLSSISDLAKFYVSKIKTVQPKGPYVIVGYSFGASVAFEMVALLEKSGESAKLVMLDGSPHYVSWYTYQHKQRTASGSTKNTDEAHGLAYFGMVCADLDYAQTARELEKLPSMENRLNQIAKAIHAKTKYPEALVSQV